MSLANSLLGQDYRLLRQLTSGGEAGTLYLAQHQRLDDVVAVKVVPAGDELLENSRVIQRVEKLFHTKMQAIADLAHRHIVGISNFGLEKIDEKEYFYVEMQYCRAGSLADQLSAYERARAVLTQADIASVISQTAEALSYAHERGVAHLDIKPSNLLLGDHGLLDLRVTDFGLAHFFATISGRGLSQSPYMRGAAMSIAPEQWDGQAVLASDQYALAVLAFYLLTSRFPFQGPLSQLIQQHQVAPAPAPSQFNRQLNPAIDKVIKRALAKQPEKRFPSVLEFSQALASALQPAGVPSGTPAFEVTRPAPAPLSPIPPTLYASAEAYAADTEQKAMPGAEALLRASTARLEAGEEDTLRAPTEKLALRAEEVALVKELAAVTLLAPALESAASQPAAERGEALVITATSPVLAEDEAALLVQPPALTSDAPALLALSSGDPEGDALSLLMQPPELTSDAPALLAPSLAATGDTPTLLAPGLSHTRAQNTQSAIPATRLASRPAAFSMALAIQPAAAALSGQPALRLNQAPALPPILPALPASQASARRRHFSPLQKSLAIVALALFVLLGSGALLFKNISTSGQHQSWWPGQSSGNNGGITIIVSPTDLAQTITSSTATSTTGAPGSTATTSSGSTPTTGTTPVTGSTPTTGTTPATGSGPAPTATSAPTPTPTPLPPTPTPTPHPCDIHYWSSTLSPTFAAGGTELFVSSYCNGVVYLTLTSSPASSGHEVDMQICFGLRTTNCSGWVKYSGVNVWLRVDSGLSSGTGFYINSRCASCTGSSFKIYGAVKY